MCSAEQKQQQLTITTNKLSCSALLCQLSELILPRSAEFSAHSAIDFTKVQTSFPRIEKEEIRSKHVRVRALSV